MGRYLQLQKLGVTFYGVTIASADERIKNLDKDKRNEADPALIMTAHEENYDE